MENLSLTQIHLGNYISKIGGPYITYGQRIQQLNDSNFDFLCSLPSNLNDFWLSLDIISDLHKNMLKLNINILLNNEELKRSLILPSKSLETNNNNNNSQPASTLPFPKDGISMSAIDEFMEFCGGKHLFYGLTTTDANIEAQKPVTYAYKMSFCDYLLHTNKPGVKKPIAFISHAWKYKFLDVLDAVRNHYRDQDPVIWFDLFTNNQHDAPDLDFGWWSTTFKEAIRDIGTTVMVLSPWIDPIPLTRAWCLYEIYSTIDTNSQFQVALSSYEHETFIHSIAEDINCIKNMLAVVNVQRSEAWNPLDKQRIFDIIEKTVGFNEVNLTVTTRLREWIVMATEKALSESKNELEKIELSNSLGLLYGELSNYDNALPYTLYSYEKTLELKGESHEHTLQRMNNLAILYDKQLKYDDAIPLLEKCIELYTLHFGSNYSNTVLTKQTLAIIYLNQKKYSDAIVIFKDCLEYFQKDEFNLTALYACMYNLGICYDYLQQSEQAKEILQKLYDILIQKYGPEHMDTLRVMTSLGSIYYYSNQIEEAISILEKAYEVKRIKFGQEHLSTLVTANFLGKIYFTLHNYELAVKYFEPCYERYIIEYTLENPTFLNVTYYLVISYYILGNYIKTDEICMYCLSNNVEEINPNYASLCKQYRELSQNFISQVYYNTNIQYLPHELTHISHEHLLTKRNISQQTELSYSCDICGKACIGYVYSCITCGYDCHPSCVCNETMIQNIGKEIIDSDLIF